MEMLGLSSEPSGGSSQLEQGQDAAIYHAMSPSSSDNTNNSKMASKGIPISR